MLQINEKATQEVIEKVFKVLAKKYHPDLQEEEKKKESAEKFKEINEAYQVLSDPEKREEYDKQLELDRMQQMSQEEILRKQNEQLKRELQMHKNIKTQNSSNVQNNEESIWDKAGRNGIYEQNNNYTNNNNNFENQTYQNNNYSQEPHYVYYKDLPFKLKAKYFIIDKLKWLLAILITIGVIVLIYQIPFVNKFFKNLYEENIIIKAFVDWIMRVFHIT